MIVKNEFEKKHEYLLSQNVKVRVFNPDWEGNQPCWDIELSNGNIHKRVTESKIRQATSAVLDYPMNYMDIVRQINIDAYNIFHCETILNN